MHKKVIVGSVSRLHPVPPCWIYTLVSRHIRTFKLKSSPQGKKQNKTSPWTSYTQYLKYTISPLHIVTFLGLVSSHGGFTQLQIRLPNYICQRLWRSVHVAHAADTSAKTNACPHSPNASTMLMQLCSHDSGSRSIIWLCLENGRSSHSLPSKSWKAITNENK